MGFPMKNRLIFNPSTTPYYNNQVYRVTADVASPYNPHVHRSNGSVMRILYMGVKPAKGLSFSYREVNP